MDNEENKKTGSKATGTSKKDSSAGTDKKTGNKKANPVAKKKASATSKKASDTSMGKEQPTIIRRRKNPLASKPKRARSSAPKPKGARSSAPRPKGARSSAPKPKGARSSAPKPKGARSSAPKPKGARSSATRPKKASPSAPKPKKPVLSKGIEDFTSKALSLNLPAAGLGSKKRVVNISKDGKLLQGLKKLVQEKDEEDTKKKRKYQHKRTYEPPKRVRKMITRSNTEVLKKLAEIVELEKVLDPEAAKRREEKEIKRLQALEGTPLMPQKMNKKADRYLKKFNMTPMSTHESLTTKKLLSYKLLFNYTPLEEMSDKDAVANIRLLFLAHADHKKPKTLDKFIKYMKNNLCNGISDEQLDRVMKLLVDNRYILVLKNEVLINIT